jgi:hypothetical protein
MDSSSLDKLTVSKKTGSERFHVNGQVLPFDVLSFWRWSSSDLVNNAMRGMLAEYLVACDLGITDGMRVEWDAYDLQTRQGVKVEVKSAAYLQSWHQRQLSPISFDIRPTIGWDASTNTSEVVRKRPADVYVFALLKHQDKASLDPLNVTQWDFYVLPAATLDVRVPTQKRLSLTTLQRLDPLKVQFGEMASTIAELFGNVGAHPGS